MYRNIYNKTSNLQVHPLTADVLLKTHLTTEPTHLGRWPTLRLGTKNTLHNFFVKILDNTTQHADSHPHIDSLKTQL